MRVLVATNNAGKVREYRQLLAAHLPGVEILTLRDVGIETDVEESGQSFEENARLKARAERAERELAKTRTALEIMGKAHALLELLSESADSETPSTR